MRLRPFAAVRPTADVAARVASVPYDVVDRAEAAALAEGNPLSFLHVVRAEIDLPDDVDPYDDRVYARAAENLARMRADGILVRDDAPALYAYRLKVGDHVQTAVVGCVHTEDYDRGVIRRHEKTRAPKERDRTRHILTTRAHAEPVLLAHDGPDTIDALVQAATEGPPLFAFTADDGVEHALWRIDDPTPLVEAFGALDHCYVADGHHRCASASLAAAECRRDGAGDGEHDWFPAALFPAGQLRILAYNRVVSDLAGMTPDAFLQRLAEVGTVVAGSPPVPPAPGSFAIYLAGQWHTLTLDPVDIDRDDPIRSLDCDLLQRRVLEPLLGIGDPRSDPRIDFVGGSRGTDELERRVDRGAAAVAFSMFPTTIDQLFRVADAGEVMPPKSTWFEPKLRSGLVVHPFDP